MISRCGTLECCLVEVDTDTVKLLKDLKIKCFKQSCWFGACGLRYSLLICCGQFGVRIHVQTLPTNGQSSKRWFSYSAIRLCETLVCWPVEVYAVKPLKYFQIKGLKLSCWFWVCVLRYFLLEALWTFSQEFIIQIRQTYMNNHLFSY